MFKKVVNENQSATFVNSGFFNKSCYEATCHLHNCDYSGYLDISYLLCKKEALF